MSPKYIRRFRNKRGFGVHSPFAFDLITSVLRRPLTEETAQRMHNCTGEQSRLKRLIPNRRKNQMLVNLLNHLQPTRVLVMGSPETAFTQLLTLSDLNPTVERFPIQVECMPEPFEFIYLNGVVPGKSLRDSILTARSLGSPNAVLLIDRLDESKEQRKAWKEILNGTLAQMIIDQKSQAFLFFDQGLNRKNYFI